MATRIAEAFDTHPYREQVAQGLDPPCFTIRPLRHDITRQLGRRSFVTNLFEVTYFPESDVAPRAECLGVQFRLSQALEYVDLEDGPVRGTNREGVVSDGVLVFTVNYDFHILDIYEAPEMEVLEMTLRVRK